MRPVALFLSAAVIGLMSPLAYAADSVVAPTVAPVSSPAAPAPVNLSVLTDEQKAAVEQIVRDLLTKKEPQLVYEAAKVVQDRQEAEELTKSQQALTANRDKVFNDPTSPVGGNLKGDVTVVEFFDYQCGYCKQVQEAVVKLLDTDKNIKIIYKEYPILGANSVTAAKVSLAVYKEDKSKYVKFHDALMSVKDHPNEEMIYKIAKDAGFDVDKLKKDAADPAIDAIVEADQKLGQEIGAKGTPTFVIGDKVYPAALPYEQLKDLVDKARAAAAKK